MQVAVILDFVTTNEKMNIPALQVGREQLSLDRELILGEPPFLITKDCRSYPFEGEGLFLLGCCSLSRFGSNIFTPNNTKAGLNRPIPDI